MILVMGVVLCFFAGGGRCDTTVVSTAIQAERCWVMQAGQWRNVRLRLGFDVYWEYTACHIPCSCQIDTTGVHVSHPPSAGSFSDHLVLQDADQPGHRGRPLLFRELERSARSDTMGLGWWESRGWQETCYRSDETPPGCCDSALYTGTVHGEATVLATIPTCGRWNIFYSLDRSDWYYLMGYNADGRLSQWPADRTVIISTHDLFHTRVDTNFVAYILAHGNYSAVTVNMDTCPEPFEADGEISFEGYWRSNRDSAACWLPVPGDSIAGNDTIPKDSIGLAFRVNSPSGTKYRIMYALWEISKWKGECLNSPRFAGPDPEPSGWEGPATAEQLDSLSKGWDITICEPDRFRFLVTDKRSLYPGYSPSIPAPWDTLRSRPRDELPGTRPYDITCVFAVTEDSLDEDTLWLKAHDYAAHCLVTPVVVDGGKGGRLHGFVNPLNHEDSLWTVTVPLDYDGYSDIGVNYGDGMADCWEQSAFGVTDPTSILPFITVTDSGNFLADQDTMPPGRRIGGDYLSNFEEYRGVMVGIDSIYPCTTHVHVRTDPLRKTVLVHLRSNVEDSTKLFFPGYIYSMETAGFEPEFYLTDSLRWSNQPMIWGSEEEDRVAERQRNNFKWRDINYNKVGAGRWYYGYGLPTSTPVPDTSFCNAATFWRRRDNPADEAALPANPNSCPYPLGISSVALPFLPDSSSIPRLSSRSVISADGYSVIGRGPYYSQYPAEWLSDCPRAYRRTIAHEFSHQVGMMHIPAEGPDNYSVMAPVNIDRRLWVLFPSQTIWWANASQDSFTVKEK